METMQDWNIRLLELHNPGCSIVVVEKRLLDDTWDIYTTESLIGNVAIEVQPRV